MDSETKLQLQDVLHRITSEMISKTFLEALDLTDEQVGALTLSILSVEEFPIVVAACMEASSSSPYTTSEAFQTSRLAQGAMIGGIQIGIVLAVKSLQEKLCPTPKQSKSSGN